MQISGKIIQSCSSTLQYNTVHYTTLSTFYQAGGWDDALCPSARFVQQAECVLTFAAVFADVGARPPTNA